MATLFDLTGKWLELYDMADDPDMDADMWFDTIEGLDGEIEDKADGYAKVITQLNADATAIKAEEDRLYRRRTTIENRIKNMKSRLQGMMEITGKKKIKTELFSFGIQKNPASVVIDEQYIENIPAEYLIAQDPKIDRQKIKEDLKAGKNLDGIAHLEQSYGLRIR